MGGHDVQEADEAECVAWGVVGDGAGNSRGGCLKMVKGKTMPAEIRESRCAAKESKESKG